MNIEEQREFLLKNKYLVFPKLLPEEQFEILWHYLNLKCRFKAFDLDPDQILDRWMHHNDPAFKIMHKYVEDKVNNICYDKVIASYVFLAVYHPGQKLDKHHDRDQCSWNVSLCVGQDHISPFFIDVEGKVSKLELEYNDAVLYRGTKDDHWRETIDQTLGVCIYHFVSSDFEGDLY